MEMGRTHRQTSNRSQKARDLPEGRIYSSRHESSHLPNSSSKPQNLPALQNPPSRQFDRGNLPIHLDHTKSALSLLWTKPPDALDYGLFLPIFFDGLREKTEPYRFMAIRGAVELIEKGGSKCLPIIPQLILPMKGKSPGGSCLEGLTVVFLVCLNTRQPDIIVVICKLIQKMINLVPGAGEVFVPYYRHLLPVMGSFMLKKLNIGDPFDFHQRALCDVSAIICDTLELLQQSGGEVSSFT